MAAAKNPSRGERHYRATLTDHDVVLIRELVEIRASLLEQARRLSNRALAEKFECSRQLIDKIGRYEARIDAKPKR